MPENPNFSLDMTSGIPFYKQIILQVEMAIADGRLVTGDQLPTVRSLAVSLRINPNTVARAYGELEIRGVVSTQQGSGTYISDKKLEFSDVERERIITELAKHFVSNAAAYGFTIPEIIARLRELDGSGDREVPERA